MSVKISVRLVWAVISILLEFTAVVVIVLWGLPKLGVDIPRWGSVTLITVLIVGWGTWSVIIYRKGSRALRQKPLVGLPNMLGTRGEVVSPLTPEGLVKIKGELWVAESESGEIRNGGKVVVVGQDRLKLVVRDSDALRDGD
jgi:membrane-bound ClpP family serine protease